METTGWLPVQLRPVSPRASVRWMYFGREDLTEPFFRQSVLRLKAAAPPAPETTGTIAQLIDIGRRLPQVRPAGLIFHISRCGSTLLANALRCAADRVVPEAGPVCAAFFVSDNGALLDCLFRIYACHPDREPKRAVVKFTSWNILFWRTIRAVWPDVPSVAVIRDPIEVMSSNLKDPSGWMRWRSGSRRMAGTVFGWSASDIEAMSAEEYCARVLGRFYRSAIEMTDASCHLVDYSNLNPHRAAEIAEAFGFQVLPARCERAFGYYSKDPGGRQPFQPDAEEKRRVATPTVKEMAEKWARPFYAELLQVERRDMRPSR